MSKNIEIKIVIDPPLAKYFEEEMNKRTMNFSVAEEITAFLATVLNDSAYPITSIKSDMQEIHLNYRPKSFADPIFQTKKNRHLACDPSILNHPNSSKTKTYKYFYSKLYSILYVILCDILLTKK